MKDVQATAEASSPQKRKANASKHEISFFMGHFCPSGSRSKIYTDPDTWNWSIMNKKCNNKRSLSVNTEPFFRVADPYPEPLSDVIRIWTVLKALEIDQHVWGYTMLHFPLLSFLLFSSLFTWKLMHILFILFQYAKSVSLTNEKVKTHKKQGRFQVGRGDSDDSSEGNNRIFEIKITNPFRPQLSPLKIVSNH